MRSLQERSLKPPAKSTLSRMQRTAQAEADRLDAIDNAPDYMVRKRDDFIGIVRLIEAILSSKEVTDLLRPRVSAQTLFATDTDVEVAD